MNSEYRSKKNPLNFYLWSFAKKNENFHVQSDYSKESAFPINSYPHIFNTLHNFHSFFAFLDFYWFFDAKI